MDQLTTLIKGRQFSVSEKINLPPIVVSKKILEETKKGLLSFAKGEELFEGLVYWVGVENDQGFQVTRVIVPRAMATPVSFRVNAEENARIMAELVKKNEQIIAQVSSRPPGDSLQHSLIEEEMGFLPFEGMISLLVANYGQEGLLPLAEETAVFVYTQGDFISLPKEKPASLITIA